MKFYKKIDFVTNKEIYLPLINKIDELTKTSEVLRELVKKFNNGKPRYTDLYKYTVERGEIIAKVFNGINLEDIPNKLMNYEYFKTVFEPIIYANYLIISDNCEKVQANLNERAGLHLKALKPKYDSKRVDDECRHLAVEEPLEEDKLEAVKVGIAATVVNLTQSVVDESVKINVEFQHDSGLDPQIQRIAVSDCCEWCSKLAGTYDYDEANKTNDIYRRHKNCKCQLDFAPIMGIKKGKRK